MIENQAYELQGFPYEARNLDGEASGGTTSYRMTGLALHNPVILHGVVSTEDRQEAHNLDGEAGAAPRRVVQRRPLFELIVLVDHNARGS